jgi:RNA polymerase-binding transcription factor DksA
METTIKERYSDADLAEFKSLIEGKIVNAEKQLKLYQEAFKNGSANDTEDTAPTFKSFDDGSNTLSKEANSALAIRQGKFIRDLKNALIRIENKTFGICRVTKRLINKERLKLVPHATLSIEAKNNQG